MAQAVIEFQTLLGELSREMQSRIERLVSAVSQLSQSDLLALITDVGPQLLEPFIAAAGELTALWYDDQNPASDFTATPVDPPASEDLAATARWAMLQDDPAAAWSGAASKALFDSSRETVIANAKKEGVKWARYAQENACGFCRMLSVKGYFYKSEQSAKAVKHADAAGHSHCNCVVYPQRGPRAASSEFLKTYEPILKQWKKDYDAAREAVGKDASAIANAIDYLPGGRRYKGDNAPPNETSQPPVNLDAPKSEQPPVADTSTGNDARTAKRLLPGLEKSLAALRAQGLPENSPQIQYHLTAIARLRRQLAVR